LKTTVYTTIFDKFLVIKLKPSHKKFNLYKLIYFMFLYQKLVNIWDPTMQEN